MTAANPPAELDFSFRAEAEEQAKRGEVLVDRIGSPTAQLAEHVDERLKKRLLTLQLAELPRPELNAPLRRAANEAAALAWVTLYPLLVFPALFEEKAATAVSQTERQARIYQTSRELLGV